MSGIAHSLTADQFQRAYADKANSDKNLAGDEHSNSTKPSVKPFNDRGFSLPNPDTQGRQPVKRPPL
jgi:hypothetical protein